MTAPEAKEEGIMMRLRLKTLYSGWWHWVVTVSSAIQFFIVLGFLQNYSILFVSFQEEFGSGAALTGWPSSIAWSLTFLGSPFDALLLYRITNRTMTLLGQCILCAGIVMTSFVPSVKYAIITYGVGVGVGNSFVNHAASVVVLNWFADRDYVRANAIVTMGSSIGMFVFSPVLTASFARFGWRASLRFVAGGCLALSFFFGVFLVEPPPNDDPRHREKQRAIKEEGEREHISLREEDDKDYEAASEETSTMNVDLQDKEDDKGGNIQMETDKETRLTEGRGCCSCHWELCHMVRCLDTWLWTIAIILLSFGWTFFVINFASFLDGRGLSSEQTALVIMLFAAGDIAGKALIAIVGKKLPVKEIYCASASMLVGTVLFGLMTIVRTFTESIILALAAGVTRSVAFGTSNVIAADLFRQYSANGVMILAMFPYGLGGLLNAPLSGGLFDVTGNYVVSLIVISTSFVCCSLVLCLFLSVDVCSHVVGGVASGKHGATTHQ
ncbi:monocarboxylate transporter 13-like [Asterias amurensis]|uniref:monocarboxylate transporter 13-like n=1 Tax=Asterias amurensis TaxID=7602 RepID=UPI003AB82275